MLTVERIMTCLSPGGRGGVNSFMGSADPLHTLERSAITPLVRRAMHSSTVEVSDWLVYPIHSGDGEGLGVYRLVGTGTDRGKQVEWSLILKAFGAPAEGGEEGDWNYWKREALVGRSRRPRTKEWAAPIGALQGRAAEIISGKQVVSVRQSAL